MLVVIKLADIQVGAGQVIVQIDRLLKVSSCSRKLVLIDRNDAQIVEGAGVTGINFGCPFEVLFSFVPLALAHGVRALIKFLSSLIWNV